MKLQTFTISNEKTSEEEEQRLIDILDILLSSKTGEKIVEFAEYTLKKYERVIRKDTLMWILEEIKILECIKFGPS